MRCITCGYKLSGDVSKKDQTTTLYVCPGWWSRYGRCGRIRRGLEGVAYLRYKKPMIIVPDGHLLVGARVKIYPGRFSWANE